jgi:hypothetical protein
MRAFALALVLLAVAALPASSYVYDTFGGKPVRWPAYRATVYHDASTFTGAFVGELKAALAVWSNVSGSSFVYTHGGASPSSDVRDSNNGNTDVYFDALPPFGLAVTIVNSIQSADITERDIAFNSTLRWTTNATNTANGPPDFRTVAIHELGHVLGLRHENFAPSVMGTGKDPAFAQHQLLADDVLAMRFLYPAGGPTPTPTGPDLVVDQVTFSPLDAGPGDEIEVQYAVRNTGTNPSGSYTVDFRLSGAEVPRVSDRDAGTVVEPTLAAGNSRSGSRTIRLPADLLPGAYRPGIILDAGGATTDVDRSNNAGASRAAIRVERAALAVPPVCRVEGELGPSGRDEFLVELMAGSRLRIKTRQSSGAASLALLLPDGVVPEETSKVGAKVKLKATVPETGIYRIWLDSRHAADSGYRLRIRAKKLTIEETVAVESGATVPFLVAAGSRVKIKVKGHDGLLPAISVAAVDEAARTNASGTRAKLGRFEAESSGTLELAIAGRDGTTGTASVKIRIDPPTDDPTLTR